MTGQPPPLFPPPLAVSLEDVREAERRLAGRLSTTATCPAPRLSEDAGCALILKLETQRRTGSFKERGALNKLLTLSADEARAGVVAMSAGNHAQAVACHAQALGVRATIVMPRFTPFAKVARTRRFGARVLLEGETLDESQAFAFDLAARQGLTFLHPYDDAAVIAGQGTVALEMLAADPDLDTLVVPVGGGGLIAGVAVAAKALRPDIAIIGVECAPFASMRGALEGSPPGIGGPTLADGIAVKTPGRLPQAIVARLVDAVLVVEESALEDAVYQLATAQKLVVEGAGAAPLAAVTSFPERFRGRRVGLIISGGNIDARLLAQVLMRGLVHEGQLVRLRIGLNDAPGVLAEVTRILGLAGANIVEVHHHRLFHNVPVKRAEIDVLVETRDRPHVLALLQDLEAAGFPTELMDEV